MKLTEFFPFLSLSPGLVNRAPLPVNILIDWKSTEFWNKMAERPALWLDTMSWAVPFHTYRIYFYVYTHVVCARDALSSSPHRHCHRIHIWAKESCFHLFSGFVARISEAKRSDAYNVWVYDRVVIVCSCCSVTRFGNWIFHQRNVLLQANGRKLDNSEWKRWNHTKNDYEGHTYIFHWVVTVMLRMSDSNSDSRLKTQFESPKYIYGACDSAIESQWRKLVKRKNSSYEKIQKPSSLTRSFVRSFARSHSFSYFYYVWVQKRKCPGSLLAI